MLVKEIVYSVLDLLKGTSDDFTYTEDFVLFLCKKYRSLLIRKEQEKERGSVDIASEFEYQQICLDLEKVPAIDGSPCTGGYYLRSVQKIPKILEGVSPKAYPIDYYQGTNVSFISRDRMRFVGSNKWLRNMIYASVGPDFHLYLTSINPQFFYLKQLRMSAIFEDFDEAAGLLCDNEGKSAVCDVLDEEFPVRDYLVPQLIELVVRELSGSIYKPKDSENNSSDDLASIASFLRNNVKSPLQRQIEG